MARTRTQPAERPAPVPYDLRVFPALNRTCEGIRQRIGDYLDYMGKAGKSPQHIDLFPEQFDALTRAVSARLDRTAPPPGAPALGWHSGAAHGLGGLSHAHT